MSAHTACGECGLPADAASVLYRERRRADRAEAALARVLARNAERESQDDEAVEYDVRCGRTVYGDQTRMSHEDTCADCRSAS